MLPSQTILDVQAIPDAAAVDRIKPPSKGQSDHFDAGYPGLALRVSVGGSRSWVHFYRVSGKQRRQTLGRYPAMSLAEARAAWRTTREVIEAGDDPLRHRSEQSDRFEAVAQEWLKRDQAENRSFAEVARVMARDVGPMWVGVKITKIRRRDIVDLIDGIADRGAVTYACRVHAHLHRLFRWSVGRGILEANPMADLPKPGVVVSRDRVLSDQELAAVWRAAETIGWPFGPAVHLLILTGCRRDEIGALQWAEIGEDSIELSGARTKNDEPRLIPLSGLAKVTLLSVPRIADSLLVFTTTGTTPVSGWSRAKLLLDRHVSEELGPILPWRIHDLRRTMATGLQRLGVGLQVVEAILGHVSGSRAGVVKIYQRHDYADEKRRALDAWAEWLSALQRAVDGGKDRPGAAQRLETGPSAESKPDVRSGAKGRQGRAPASRR